MKVQNRIIFGLSVPTLLLLTAVSIAGICLPGIYKETPNWKVQAQGQDVIDLILIVPSLLIAVVLTKKNHRFGLPLWGGTMSYLIYTFVIYCFAVHFNLLFVPYCLILGLSFYSMVCFFHCAFGEGGIGDLAGKIPERTIGVYFILIACVFYFLWLSRILPATFSKSIPNEIVEMGLPVNPVHALDLSVCLPGFLVAGIFLLRKNPFGRLIAPVLLIFSVLMDITIAVMIVAMKMRGLTGDIVPAIFVGGLAVFSGVLLSISFRNPGNDPPNA